MLKPDYIEKVDLLSILLIDDLFMDREEIIIDECLTFFFAGSQTSSIGTQNMLMYMIQQPDIMQKVRAEIKSQIIDPTKETTYELPQLLNYDNIFSLSYYANCFSESLRIEPPVMYSSLCTLIETCQIGPYTIKKGD